jgi:predicted nucleic acid-binding protein
MVYYEARRGLLANSAMNKMHAFDKLCIKLNVNSLTTADMNMASDIYAERKRSGTLIDDADLLIAAQCIVNNYVLVTNNAKHFEDIDGLIYENWIE